MAVKTGKQKAKPRKKWEAVRDLPQKIFTASDSQEIAEGLGFTLSADLCRRAAEAVQKYVVSKKDPTDAGPHNGLIDGRPHHGEKIVALQFIASHAKALLDALNDLDDDSRAELRYPPDPERFDDIAAEVGVVAGYARGAVERLKKSSGKKAHRPKAWALQFLIRDLIEIYKQATGKKITLSRDPVAEDGKRYKSTFYSFVENHLRKVPGHPEISNRALGNAIDYARKNPTISLSA